MTYCIGKCKNYKALKPSEIGRYAAGQKRCNYCEIFVEIDGIICPCCNSQLRCLALTFLKLLLNHIEFIILVSFFIIA